MDEAVALLYSWVVLGLRPVGECFGSEWGPLLWASVQFPSNFISFQFHLNFMSFI